jgi:arsenate reductase
LAALRAAGHEPLVIDYIATPPTRDELKNLSLLLRESDQSLVKKYDSLFFELRLDDRFISENEFWGAIFEHPSLINGPIVATPTKASVCRSEDAVRYFLAMISSNGNPLPPKPKSLSERALRLVAGDITTPPDAEAAAEKTKEISPAKVAKQAKAVAKEKPKPATKAKEKTVVKAKAKTSGPAKKAVKKIVKKLVKKSSRAG